MEISATSARMTLMLFFSLFSPLSDCGQGSSIQRDDFQTASHFGELQSIKQPLAFDSEGFAFGHSIGHVILFRKHLPLTVQVRCSGLVEVAAWISTTATAKKIRKMATDFVLASIFSLM
eukprot:TRINITY_DN8170_c0_g2_i1.p1 TRINITY_DN8170_c0_g2~~TRINITY_DN8170_c0_g2_i1.p1  ORF type:complete len:119 (-),score=20.77 TRINITY_DN8170_c0_g2_i1:798-1154(-)